MTGSLAPGEAILTLNAGSSSLKFALYRVAGGAEPLMLIRHGQIDGIGVAPHLRISDPEGGILAETRWPADLAHDYDHLLDDLLAKLDAQLNGRRLGAIGHRVVHGGAQFHAPVLIDESVIDILTALVPLAPLHQPHNLKPIAALRRLRPDTPQIACFDTAFHHTLPAVATWLPLPRRFRQEGIRRYGFHGLSYEYIARKLNQEAPHLARGRVVVAHLGNGASLCALDQGHSIDTTMGMTAVDGLMMGTRTGSIDPGVLLYLMQPQGMSPVAIEDLLYRQSGLLGVSEISSDMRSLLASKDSRAAEAIALFVYRAAHEIAGLGASLGGIDGIVFTAGIGEHAPEIREGVIARLSWLGASLDLAANRRNDTIISSPTSAIEIRVMPTDEEAMIAQHCLEALGQ